MQPQGFEPCTAPRRNCAGKGFVLNTLQALTCNAHRYSSLLEAELIHQCGCQTIVPPFLGRAARNCHGSVKPIHKMESPDLDQLRPRLNLFHLTIQTWSYPALLFLNRRLIRITKDYNVCPQYM